ncbi:MAG: zinc-ribbon domain-containing protein [Candidatus Omnitrophica bacterium]|nr:zinc-ribbon domain-containing protein [Candidatus Omnitrophota bacterium]
MALVSCPECQREVSNVATACPHCGYPLDLKPEVTPIELTGKKWKLFQAWGCGLICLALIVGIPMAASGESAGEGLAILGTLLGFLFFLVGRLGGWWHHG